MANLSALTVCTAVLSVLACQVDRSNGEVAAAPQKEVVQTADAPPGLPFSSAVRAGNQVYLSGQIGSLPGTTEVVPGGVGAETRQVFENIRGVLEHMGQSLEDVVKCTVFLRHIEDYAAMNEAYATFFPSEPPARSTIAASGLAFGALVEIDCIALAR